MIGHMPLHATTVECLDPYRLRVGLDDGSVKVVDIAKELWGEVFEPLRDPAFFRQAFINPETGAVEWPNGADLAPTFLHERGVTT